MKKYKSIEVMVEDLGSHGEGVGRHEDRVVFIQGALPQEKVLCTPTIEKKRYVNATLNQVLTPSPHRQNPPCKLFGRCGGCQLLHLCYDEQLKVKERKVRAALERIGGFSIAPLPCLPSPQTLHYRNKIQVPCQKNDSSFLSGFFAYSSHDIVDMDHCPLHCESGDNLYYEAKQLCKQYRELPRFLMIRTSAFNQNSVAVWVAPMKPSLELQNAFRGLKSLVGLLHNIGYSDKNTILHPQFTTLFGHDTLEEKLGSLSLRYTAGSFFQINPKQAECLYQRALEMLQLDGNETILDAFCGVGSFSLFLAQKAKHVFGIEIIEEAVGQAKKNAIYNHLENTDFIVGKSEEVLKTLPPFDIAVINPPRTGCQPAFLAQLRERCPQTILYISCDPATLARDLHYLCETEYEITEVQPVDMFPQTSHVETIALLRFLKKDSIL